MFHKTEWPKIHEMSTIVAENFIEESTTMQLKRTSSDFELVAEIERILANFRKTFNCKYYFLFLIPFATFQ